VETAPPTEPATGAAQLPEPGALVRESRRGPALVYAGGEQVWRSEDGGRTWRNLTQLRQGSLLGARVNDLAVDPENPDRVAVAAATGVWISLDGGLSWQGWNENLPAFRLVGAARMWRWPAPRAPKSWNGPLASGWAGCLQRESTRKSCCVAPTAAF